VALGTALGQGAMLLATPFLARAYSPAEFGTLALLTTVSNIAMMVACLRYDVALPSAEERDIHGLLVTAALTSLTLGAVVGVALLALARSPAAHQLAGGLLDHPLLVGACVALVGLYQATNAWFLRGGAYRSIAVLRVAQGGGFGVLAAVPGIGLLAAHVMSFGGGLLAALRAATPSGPRDERWVDVGVRYRKFPLYNLPGSVLDVVGYSLCIWVVSSYYGRSAAGEYAQIQRIIGAPLMLTSMSLGQILLRGTAELLHAPIEMRRLLLRLLRMMAGLGAAALVLLWLAGKPALQLILGAQWRVDREMIVLLGVAVFTRACVSPLSAVLLTLRRFGTALSWQAAYFCSASLAMPFVAGRYALRDYVRFYAVHEAAFYAVYLYLIFTAVRKASCAEYSAS
jgi:O-antigen/teichoic acid export membrane protein